MIDKNLNIGATTIKDICIIKLAYKLEFENPHLNFFEINKLVKQHLVELENVSNKIRNTNLKLVLQEN